MELHICDRSCVTHQLCQLLARPQIPQLDHALCSGTGYPLPIRTELDFVDLGGVTLVGEDAALPPCVPQPQTGVTGARAQEVAVGMEVNTLDPALVTCQGPQQLGGLQVPDLESA